MHYIKLALDTWFTGSMRWELTAEERAVWVDFMALAGQHTPKGEFEYSGISHLANLCRVSEEAMKVALDLFERTGRIKIVSNIEKDDPTKCKIVLVKWNKYQPTYKREEKGGDNSGV